ncbi:MAG TPA: metallophosphoesterase, partial [Actinomycetota bacterium]|nr:metallophosphoesterase [Actinomycetota bacterium]
MKIGCVGDIHLGAGVAAYGPERLHDQEKVLNQALDLFEEQGCELVLIAGDTWDGPLVPPEQYVAFSRTISHRHLTYLMIPGNGRHDLATREVNALRVYEESYSPKMLTIRCEPDVIEYRLDNDIRVGCLPWAPINRYIATRNGASRDAVHAEVAELLLTIAKDLHAKGANILLGHWALSGTSLPSGLPVDLANEPILDTEALADIGFDAIVMGHIHKPQTFADGAGFYVGSPLPLNHGEAGYEHGVWIFDTEDGPQFHPLESRRFITVDWDEDEAKTAPDFTDAIVRIKATWTEEAARRVNVSQWRQGFLDAGAWRVSIEPTIVREQQTRIAV